VSIRKIKRRAMARMADPRVEIRVQPEFLGFFAGMTSIERENVLRACLKEYADYHLSRQLKETAHHQ
jgi:hypothetical protein